MRDVDLREAVPSDENDVASIAERVLLPADSSDRDNLRRFLWETPDMIRVAAVQDQRLVGAAFGTTSRAPASTDAGSVAFLVVHPDHQRRGVGGALLTEVERRFAARRVNVVSAGGGLPRFWWAGVDEEYRAALQFFRKSGYVESDETVNMTAPTGAGETESPLPAGVSIERLDAGTWPSFHAWLRDEWTDEFWAWADEVEPALHREPPSCFIALRDGRFLGFAAYDTNRHGWFGPMGTSPEARGTGIGAALLRRCAKDLRELGDQAFDIGSAGPRDFYRKTVGAEISRRFLLLRKTLD
ncbi:GNAT family N-acetyltransferase [Amnibacterium sp. CER49]|uniref:GNAT family N-acetyltransferase n=1 Tax=Amnibacterium sp. CER49 TaxID=3039161 RepID=UPI00244A0FB4|nr:GNAT family N-acetyltransferase [Amnibacterium sp. CER49]MDH2442587.1 GNAT family N-acetyltransferase [Amnibacterium sp. CER49]